MSYDFESYASITVMLTLIVVYLYILVSPSQHRTYNHSRNFVIPEDTIAAFQNFLKDPYENEYKRYDMYDNPYNETSERNEWENGKYDDFFLFEPEERNEEEQTPFVPNEPSENYHCGNDWILIRSQLNYKFLWMHTSNMWMSATATIDTPIHHKSFKLSPVETDCTAGGWVLLQEGDSNNFIMMIPPISSTGGGFSKDEWVVKLGTSDINSAKNDTSYHFHIENDGYVLNKGSMGYLNVMTDSEYAVRGHSGGWDRSKPASKEYGSNMVFEYVNASIVQASIDKEDKEERDSIEQDQKYIKQIASFPINNAEKRVISFGLYGSNPKYTHGAIRNIQEAKIYFPGWICRFYITSDVPTDIVNQLKELSAEIELVPPGKGYISGMFWRFMVAADPTVDRYIIRDSDSRMNARDRLAVEDWIESKYAVHIQRDHVNHCLVMNGGMWGGTKGAVTYMKEKIEAWNSRDEYAADLNFLEQQIWPEIRNIQISHDSYCCDRFPNARPYPSKRPMNYQHVGQVFDAEDHPRLNDIDGFIRGVPVPGSCRKHADWIYG